MKKLTLSFLSLILIIASCDRFNGSEEISDPGLYHEYIQAYTTGIISANEPIRIQFNQMPELFAVKEESIDKLIRISPSIAGVTRWLDSQTLVFSPDKSWDPGETYAVTLRLDHLWKVSKELEVFNFDFTIRELDFTVLEPDLQMLDNEGKLLYRYEGLIKTSDEMDVETLLSFFDLDAPSGKEKLRIESSGPNSYSYIIDSLPAEKDSYSINLKWDARKKDINQKGEYEFEVPGTEQFKVLNVSVDQGVNQRIRVYFTGQLDISQDLNGLIYLANLDNIRMIKKDNLVEVYLQERIDGECELIIEQGVRNSEGRSLSTSEKFNLAMEPIKPQVEFLGNGVIMPDSRELVLPFKAVSLKAVDIRIEKVYSSNITQFLQRNQLSGGSDLKYVGRPVLRKSMRLDGDPTIDLGQWNTFSLDLSELMQKDPHALYRVRISFKKAYSDFRCEGSVEDQPEDFFVNETFSEDELAPYDDARYYYESYYPQDYSWRERENPCDNSYYTNEKFPARNILSTNLGLIVKSADQKHFTVVVSDLLDLKPVSGASISFLNYQKQEIGISTSDNEGFSEIDLTDVPFMLIASSGNQKAYLRLDDGSSLSMSNFDISGREVQKGIKGMIIGERGVWRPGDTLFLTFLLEDRNKLLPDNQPVDLKIYNSKGQLSTSMVKTTGVNGFYTFVIPTSPDDPTGSWTARVQVGGAKFEKLLKVETIKPNRLKVDLSFNMEPLKAEQAGQKGSISSTWMHGAVARGLECRVGVRLVQDKKGFSGYQGYTFWDPAKNFWPIEREVFTGTLDQKGKATFDLNLPLHNQLPGPLKAVFTSRVLEKGGDYSTGVQSFAFAPHPRYVGIQLPKGQNGVRMLETDMDHTVKIATVDAEGHPLSVDNLEVKIYKISWRWWWSAGEDNLANYIGGSDTKLIQSKTISTSNGLGSFPFRIEYPDWGRFYIKVIDPKTGHSCGDIFYIDWPSSINRGDRKNPSGVTMLSFTSEKDTALIGEEVEFTFPSSGKSRALASIENGSGVLDKFWISCDEGETSFSLKITPDMTPNIFVHLSLIQPHGQTSNDLPIRLYGVLPLTVINPDTRLYPEIKLPSSIRPNETYTIELSEKNNQDMSYTIAVVDEGLLDLTRFRVPDPWEHFNAKEALGVKTWDLYDEVLGAFGGKIGKMLAIGGDEEALLAEDKEANRFKPVVTFMGPFELKGGKKGVHDIKMTNYIGSVKAMVIAGNGEAWGSAEATATVKQPLMVLATAPRILGPGEEMELPVNIFVMEDKIRSAKISLSSTGPLDIVGSSKKNISFPEPGEYPESFTLKAGSGTGVASISVEVISGNEKASYDIELMVRNPNPYTTRVEKDILTAGEDKDFEIQFHGTPGTNTGTLEVSALPDFELEKNLKFLINYPYGCIEQTSSAGFAQLNLDLLTKMEDSELQTIQKNIQATLRKISSFQLPDGSLSYWPGTGSTSEWGTSYAAHFFLLAEQKGYLLPPDLKKKWLRYQFNKASETRLPEGDTYPDIVFQQAYRLYTLSLAGKPNRSAMNRLRENGNLGIEGSWRLAAAYALAGRTEVARKLVLDLDPKETRVYKNPGITFGSRLRDQSMILETLCLLEEEEDAFELVITMAEQFKGGWHSTQTSAFALHALAQFARNSTTNKEVEFEYKIGKEKQTVKSDKPIYQIDLNPTADNIEKINISNTSGGSLFISLTTRGQALPGDEESGQSNLFISVTYSDMGSESLDVGQIKQGTDFIASVRVRNPGLLGAYNNLALSELFPSGWEIRNLRLNDQGNTGNNDPFDFQDIRDDRVDTFFKLGPNESRSYRVLLHAAYPGKYYLPPVSCEDMYDGRIYARDSGRWIEVTKN